MKKLPLVFCVFFLSSCSGEEKLKLVLDSYLGYNQSTLVQNFGQPNKIFNNGGNKVLEFEFVEHHFNLSPNNTANSLNTPSASGGVRANGSGGVNFNYGDLQGSYSKDECRLTFTVDPRDTVKDWHHTGNACTRYATRENVNHQYILDLPRITDKTYGFNFNKSSKGMRVKDINALSSAYGEGLRKGDVISKINGVAMQGLPTEFAHAELGKNTQAKLEVLRGKEVLNLSIKKADIPRLALYKKSLQKFMGFSS